MKEYYMKSIGLCLGVIVLAVSTTICWAESKEEQAQRPEPTLYDHYLSLKGMQESLAGRSLEEEARLQPQIKSAEQRACERLQKERREGVQKEDYRRQGGDEFLVFSLQFEQYCQPSQ